MPSLKPRAQRAAMFSACAFLLAGLSACATGPSGPSAQAELKPTQGQSVSGQLRFVQTGAQVKVSGEVRGLKPNAEHGFHIHEKGDCSSGDGMSTGGHFNPSGAAHGQHGTGAHHSGDLPALVANAQGVARVDFTSSSLSLQDGPASIVGKGLIVHRDPDDYRTQPTGNSGPRVACAVIQKA